MPIRLLLFIVRLWLIAELTFLLVGFFVGYGLVEFVFGDGKVEEAFLHMLVIGGPPIIALLLLAWRATVKVGLSIVILTCFLVFGAIGLSENHSAFAAYCYLATVGLLVLSCMTFIACDKARSAKK